MGEKFLYNRKTNKLHIIGYCQHSKGVVDGEVFNSEKDALGYDGRAVSMCKICQKKREEKSRR